MTDETATEDLIITETIAEAKAGFNLAETLRGRRFRTGSITVYTDEILGEKHFDLEAELKKVKDSTSSLGILLDAAGELGLTAAVVALQPLFDAALLSGVDAAKVAEIEAQLAPIKLELEATSLTFELRAVPPIVVKDARRRAKKALGIVGKNVSEDLEEQFLEYASAYVLSAMVTGYVSHATGDTIAKLSDSDARDLGDLLPEGEFGRLSAMVNDIQFKTVVGANVTETPDFSQGI